MYGEYRREVEVVLDERQNVASVTGVVCCLGDLELLCVEFYFMYWRYMLIRQREGAAKSVRLVPLAALW